MATSIVARMDEAEAAREEAAQLGAGAGPGGQPRKRTDLRVVKTKRTIREAFIRLMGTKGLESMTVQDILDEALVNRKTFYTYYHDKYDLAEQIAADFLAVYDDMIAQRFPASEGGRPVPFALEEIYTELNQNRKEVQAIWSIRTDRVNVFDELCKRLQRIYLGLAEYYDVEGDRTLQAYMFSTFVMSTYQHVMETDEPFETDWLLKEYERLFDVIERASRGEPAPERKS